MPETTSSNFITEKNKAANTPVMLYEVETPATSATMYICEWDTTITYPTSGGHDYLPFPLTHEGIGVNALGEIDNVKVKLSAVDRTIIDILKANDGLRGCQVVMKLVFLDQLADANANVSSTFYIDGVDTTEMEAIFTLTSKLDLYQVIIPARTFVRDHCQWKFMCEGCWLLSGEVYVPSASFTNSGTDCDHTRVGATGCKYHTNSSRFGGFPGIPMRGIYVI